MKTNPALGAASLLMVVLAGFVSGQDRSPRQGASSTKTEPGNHYQLSPEPLHRLERLNGGAIGDLFREAAGENIRSVIPLESMDDGRIVALATAVSENGYALTKASELEPLERSASPKIVARVEKGRTASIRVAGLHKENDLALIKIDARLRAIEWDEELTLKTGFWISAISNAKNDFKVGIVGAPPRPIDREGGVVGVKIHSREGSGVLVEHVFERSGANDAGMKSGDVVLFVAGEAVHSPDEFTDLVTRFDANDSIELVIERQVEGKPKKWAVDVVLGYRRDLIGGLDRNVVLSGTSSRRHTGFQSVLQHDIPLGPEAMGGPVFSIDGKAVGLNIARRDRVTTFALPGKLVRELAAKMIASATGSKPAERSDGAEAP